MPEADAIELLIKLALALAALYGAYRFIRRIVLFVDATQGAVIEIGAAAPLMREAMALIVHEFRANGGRVEGPITSEEAAQRATVKDLLLDLRAQGAAQRDAIHTLAKRTDQQSSDLLAMLRIPQEHR